MFLWFFLASCVFVSTKTKKVTMAHPSELSEKGINVSATTQREGEFVLTFPQVSSLFSAPSYVTVLRSVLSESGSCVVLRTPKKLELGRGKGGRDG